MEYVVYDAKNNLVTIIFYRGSGWFLESNFLTEYCHVIGTL